MTLLAYLAGPDVFLPNALEIGAAKKSICQAHGFEGLFPLDDAGIEVPADGHDIFRGCVAMMERADLVIANMTPFRGLSMDVGTAVEIGFMFARGKPVFGYTNVAADYADRIPPDGMSVEPYGYFDNLMCDGTVAASGGTVVRTDVAEADRFTDLRGFEEAVRQVARLLA